MKRRLSTRTAARALACSAALVVALPSAAIADEPPEPAAEVERSAIIQLAAFAEWDSCGLEPAPGDVCTITLVTPIQTTSSEVDDGTLVANQATYEVGTNGEKIWRPEDSWYGAGPVEFTMDRPLTSASAHAVVDVLLCGADGGSDCGDAKHEIAVSWTGTGETTTIRDTRNFRAGIRMATGSNSHQQRAAVATGAIDGAELGNSLDAGLEMFSGRAVFVAREGGVNGLGLLTFPLWHVVEFGSGSQASAWWDSCGEIPDPGDSCSVTQVVVAEWLEGGSTLLAMRRGTYEVDENGEVYGAAAQDALAPADLTVDRHLDTATATATVKFPECPSEPPGDDGPPPLPDEPPPPLDEHPGSECVLVPHEVSINWQATGRVVRSHSTRTVHDGDNTYLEKSSLKVRPAAATGTFDGTPFGDSMWAAIIEREENTFANDHG